MPSYSRARAVFRISTSDFEVSAVCMVAALAVQPASKPTAVADSTARPPPVRRLRRLARRLEALEGSKSMIRSPRLRDRLGRVGPELRSVMSYGGERG